MDHFGYSQDRLLADGVDCGLLAERFGTPLFVYTEQTLREHYARLKAAFAAVDPMICYAVKANGNLELLKVLAGLGAGMDVVSLGELERAFVAGVSMDRIVFAGVGKGEHEIAAALDPACSPLVGTGLVDEARLRGRGAVACFNVESAQELAVLADVAARARNGAGVRARAALRVNPDVDARTHSYTTTGKADNKFGVPIGTALELFERYGPRSRAAAFVELQGLHVHLGSPIYSVEPYVAALKKLVMLVKEVEARGTPIKSIDIGGGIAADYQTGQTPPYEAYAGPIAEILRPLVERGVRIVMEPGRTLVANAGVLLTRVRYVKQNGSKTFAVCDAGMNALIRPALYGAFHFVWPVEVKPGMTPPARREHPGVAGLRAHDVVGPICESGDFLAQERELPPLARGDLLAVFGAGAYGMSMASTYNDQPLAAEVLVERVAGDAAGGGEAGGVSVGAWGAGGGGRAVRLIRPRQTIAELLRQG